MWLTECLKDVGKRHLEREAFMKKCYPLSRDVTESHVFLCHSGLWQPLTIEMCDMKCYLKSSHALETSKVIMIV